MQEKNAKNNRKIRVILAFLCLGFLFFHFTATYLYTSPLKNHTYKKVHYVVNGYIHPLFWQNWSLFVPAPKDNKKILISFRESDSTYSEFENPIEKYAEVYQWIKFSPQGKIILGFDNALWWVYEGLSKMNLPWNRELEGMDEVEFKSKYAYTILRNLVKGAFFQKYAGEFQGAKVKFIIEDVELQKEFYLIIPIE